MREGGEGRVTNVREVDDRLAACATEDIQEGDREDVYSAVLAIRGEALLVTGRVLAPIAAAGALDGRVA